MVLGHESSGTIVSVGSGVTSLVPGDRVALEPGIPCRHCNHCKRGVYNLCPEMRFAATPPYDGSLCKFYVLPADFCVKLPENVSEEEGALVEPLAVGVHAAKLVGVVPGDSVVVFGAGPVGLLCAAVAKAFGASKVVVVDISEKRREFAHGYVATGVFDGAFSRDPKVNADEIRRRFDLGEGADRAIEASGATPCVQAAVHVLKQGGSYIQVGMGQSEVSFPLMEMAVKEVTVKGSFRYAQGDYQLAVKLIAEGKVDVKSLITARYPFEEAEKAFQETAEGKGIKVLIKGPE
jgi:D-xylulose reductase